MVKRILVIAVAASALAGCGNKAPESEAAKKLGDGPKRTLDRARDSVNDALRKGAERTREADKAN